VTLVCNEEGYLALPPHVPYPHRLVITPRVSYGAITVPFDYGDATAMTLKVAAANTLGLP